MKRVSILAAGILSSAIIPRESWALGLGELTLRSYLNEPFRAELALLESDAFDESDVLVGLASQVEFERLGVSWDFLLTRINFRVESDEFGRLVVLTTEAPLREPYLNLVVEARWPNGRLLREYTVLIDLPPRPMVAESEDASAEKAENFDNQAIVSEAGVSGAQTDGYAIDATMRPVAGAQYLVTNTDTLWRIASEGAVAGISVQQTMLEIVAANPAAFEAGNINGLRSGYVLQIPDYDDIQVDPEAALSAVALQNDEWGRGIAHESQGLTLVADGDAEAAEARVSPSGEPDTYLDPALLVESGTEPTSQAPLNVSGASTAEELQALIMTVSRLQESVDSLEAKLAERDAELVALRLAFAEQQAANPVPIVMEAPAAPRLQMIPLWSFLAGLTTLLIGVGLLIRRRLRRKAESEPVGHADLRGASPTSDIDEASNPSRLSDPQIMASKAVEEAHTYIAYGRTDQAVEVLNDAMAEGLTSVALNMCLLECYVELEQFAEAGALLARLEQCDDSELLERARQMLQDAGMPLASSSGLALTPPDHDTDVAEAAVAEGFDMDDSIYGVETNPVDSKLDLARAYLDMGDEDGARPVLMEVIKEGDLAQQAEARQLFLRLEAP
jgi:pilus assembly protein FimV